MLSLPIISAVSFVAYLVFILFKYGVPVSFSETFYLLEAKWKWLFSAWIVLATAPLGIYWFVVSPDNLKWIAVVCTIALLFVSVSCDYKKEIYTEGYIVKGNTQFSRLIIEVLKSLDIKGLFKDGWSKPLHYINSLIAIILSTIYLCLVSKTAIVSTAFLYPAFILIGLKVDGVYNDLYSLDVNNKAWIFFMEVICFINFYIFMFF